MGKFLFASIVIAAPNYMLYNIGNRVDVAECEIIRRCVPFDNMITVTNVFSVAMMLIIIICFINWIDR